MENHIKRRSSLSTAGSRDVLTSHRHAHARKAPSELAKLAQLLPGVAPPRAPTSRNLASRLLAATDLSQKASRFVAKRSTVVLSVSMYARLPGHSPMSGEPELRECKARETLTQGLGFRD